MVALAGFAGLFVGTLITFFSWKTFYEYQNAKAMRIIRSLKRQKALYAAECEYLKTFHNCNVEVIHRHEFAQPEQVTDLKFGG